MTIPVINSTGEEVRTVKFNDIKHNLYRTLRENRQERAISIVDAFLEDHVIQIGYQKMITDQELAVRQRYAKEQEMGAVDDMIIVKTVARAVEEHVKIRHDGLRTTGTVYLLKV